MLQRHWSNSSTRNRLAEVNLFPGYILKVCPLFFFSERHFCGPCTSAILSSACVSVCACVCVCVCVLSLIHISEPTRPY